MCLFFSLKAQQIDSNKMTIILTQKQISPLLKAKNFKLLNVQVTDFTSHHIPNFYRANITTDLGGKKTRPRAVLFIMRESIRSSPLVIMKEANHMGDVLARFDPDLFLDAGAMFLSDAEKPLKATKFKGPLWEFTF